MTENKNKMFVPRLGLRELKLPRILKKDIVAPVVQSYSTIGVRVLWKDDDYSEMWERKKRLEASLSTIPQIVMHINCITGMKPKTTVMVGFAYWISFNCPQRTVENFENMICRKIMSLGINVHYCKPIKGRGKYCYQDNLKKHVFIAKTVIPKPSPSPLALFLHINTRDSVLTCLKTSRVSLVPKFVLIALRLRITSYYAFLLTFTRYYPFS